MYGVGLALYFFVDVDVAVADEEGLAGPTYESFYEVFGGVGGVLEDDDVPDLGVAELVEVFLDEDSVTVADAAGVLGVDLGAAHGADGDSGA